MLVAAYRARASARPSPVCNDPWASRLAGVEGEELARRYDQGFPSAELWVAVRTAFFDREIRRLTGEAKAGQVVVLGAGFDTRAVRLAGSGVRWFEVDRLESQEEKLRRLGALADYPRQAATFVSCDFEKEDFLDRLAAAGFRAEEPAIFLWEGVTLYLPEAAVRTTLRNIARRCHARTVVLFDYIGKKMGDREVRSAGDLAIHAVSVEVGEPIVFGSNDLLPLLYEEGYRFVHTLSFDEATLDLTGTYDRARMFRFQRLALCSRTAP